VVGGDEVPVDDWLTLASLLGELIVAKARYGDHLTNVRRRESVSIAAEMRWALLPPLTFSSPEVSVSGILQPAYGVAGDAFDYALRSGHAAVAVFDAMGHGLMASRVANLAVGALRAGRRSGLSGAELLLSVDEVVAEQFDGVVFATAQLLDLDLETGVAQVFTAGHPPPIRFAVERTPQVLSVLPGLPLGLGPSTYEPTVVRLEPGDALLMVSDGIYEARSADDEQYGWDRMVAAVQDRVDAGDRSPEVLRRAIRSVQDFEAVRRDDMTMAFVRWRPDVAGLQDPPSAEQLQEAGTN
jgi:serine phosphatase RsbU (regulator of sigma subunit)